MPCAGHPCGHTDLCQCAMVGLVTTCDNRATSIVSLMWPEGATYLACTDCADKVRHNQNVVDVRKLN